MKKVVLAAPPRVSVEHMFEAYCINKYWPKSRFDEFAKTYASLSPARNVRANELWALTGKGAGVTVGIIDKGPVWSVHPDLKDRVIVDKNIMNGPHSTNCAGIIAANGLLQGVAPEVQVLSRVGADVAPICTAIEELVQQGVQVICISMSVPDIKKTPDCLRIALNSAKAKKVLVCWSVPNEQTEDTHLPGVIKTDPDPSLQENVILIDEVVAGKMWFFPYQVDILVSIDQTVKTTHTEKDWILNKFGGTSAATPFVAGVAALLYSMDNNMTAQQVKQILIESAELPPNSPTDPRMDAWNAVEMARQRKLSAAKSARPNSKDGQTSLRVDPKENSSLH